MNEEKQMDGTRLSGNDHKQRDGGKEGVRNEKVEGERYSVGGQQINHTKLGEERQELE